MTSGRCYVKVRYHDTRKPMQTSEVVEVVVVEDVSDELQALLIARSVVIEYGCVNPAGVRCTFLRWGNRYSRGC